MSPPRLSRADEPRNRREGVDNLRRAGWTSAVAHLIFLPPHDPGHPAGLPTPVLKESDLSMSNALDVTDSTWDSNVLQSETPVLVDFWAPWCGPCRAMSPYIDKLADEYDGRLKVVKLNTQDNTEVSARYGITSIPTFLVIKAGEVATQIVGAQKYDSLKDAVDPHL